MKKALLVLATMSLFACGASSQKSVTGFPPMTPVDQVCGYPVGCYCSSNGLFIGADGQPSTMNGMPINCIPGENDRGHVYPPVTKLN